MGQLGKYSFINAKVRAMLSNLLTPEQFDHLREAEDVAALLADLAQTPYRQMTEKFAAGDLELEALEQEFMRHDIAIHRKLFSTMTSTDEKNLLFLLMQRYEIEQLKVVLRLWHKNAPVPAEDYLLGENICFPLDWRQLLIAKNIEEIILLLDQTPYRTPLLKAREKFKESHSLFYLEVALDLDYYERISAAMEKLSAVDKTVAKAILGVEVDIENINWLVRSKKYYALGMGEMLPWLLPGGARIQKENIRNIYLSEDLDQIFETLAVGPYARLKDLVMGNMALLENILYEVLSREVRRALGGFPFTIGIILGYLVLKRKETGTLVSLIYAKKYGWKKEELAQVFN